MIILGLGSNIGDRLTHLRQALHAIKKISGVSVKQISSVYISDALLPPYAPETWQTPYLNLAIRCETSLNPYDLLAHIKNIEKQLGRTPEKNWGPRIIDIDLLAWDDLIQYDGKLHIPHEHLHQRPFALWPLADIAPRWIYPLPGPLQGKTATQLVERWPTRFSGDAPLHTKQIAQRVDTPQLVGIVNLTPDSFSEDGIHFDIPQAILHIRSLVDSGAEVIDIGAEATGPSAKSISAEQEWERLYPLLQEIMSIKKDWIISPKISIDTRYPTTAEKALHLGVDYINDVSGLDDSLMQQIIASSHCDVIFMHHLGIPVNKTNILPLDQDPVSIVYSWAEKKLSVLERKGIDKKRLIFDIGIGYGKTAQQSLELIRNIDVFKNLDIRLLIGHSRKSFLSQFTALPASQRDIETLAVSLALIHSPVDYLRIHNVDMHARAFKVMQAI